jgi:hypothetical protein
MYQVRRRSQRKQLGIMQSENQVLMGDLLLMGDLRRIDVEGRSNLVNRFPTGLQE